MDETLLETSSLLKLPQEISINESQASDQLNGNVQQLTLFWKNFLNSTSEPTRVN